MFDRLRDLGLPKRRPRQVVPAPPSVPDTPEWPEIAFDERMATVEFRVADQPHITVDTAVCRTCVTQDCVAACPADLFVPTSDGGILFNYEQCLECGLCYLLCAHEGAIAWSYPPGGHGAVMRWS